SAGFGSSFPCDPPEHKAALSQTSDKCHPSGGFDTWAGVKGVLVGQPGVHTSLTEDECHCIELWDFPVILTFDRDPLSPSLPNLPAC
ncbi:unnamed protein product, partial [Pleuronectes platessa]